MTAAPDSFSFELLAGSVDSPRAGTVRTAHGSFRTPCFMAVGTQGAAKSLSPDQLRSSGIEVLLCNAYHLALRPGAEAVAGLGGLHEFARWPGPMLTDSGGFQIWSMRDLAELTEEGVRFRSHLDGSEHFFAPEGVISLEETLGADMIMPLDECLEYPAELDRARRSAERTVRWAERSLKAASGRCALFGIVQGGSHSELRVWSAERLVEMGFAGYAVGGLSVGEGPFVFGEVLRWTLANSRLPEFGLQEFTVRDGALCGVVESGYYQGKRAADRAPHPGRAEAFGHSRRGRRKRRPPGECAQGRGAGPLHPGRCVQGGAGRSLKTERRNRRCGTG